MNQAYEIESRETLLLESLFAQPAALALGQVSTSGERMVYLIHLDQCHHQ